MSENKKRMHLIVRGAVQGVGFRPFVFRLARDLELAGWVNNASQGVFIEVEGSASSVSSFLDRLKKEQPPLASISELRSEYIELKGETKFKIVVSDGAGDKTALLLPDMATCRDCRREIFDPKNRRYLYPFTNCTNCGPRFSIIRALPYDRTNTTMSAFAMCKKCLAEYRNPLDRRFHAQPNACANCGPHLELWDKNGKALAFRQRALLAACRAIEKGEIVAVKGLGGFHLMADAKCRRAITELRRRKAREAKPFALMYPSLEQICRDCEVDEKERELLLSCRAPIVLLSCRESAQIAPEVAPKNPFLGVMLPYTPLHHIMMSEINGPVVATSGNLSREPICTDEQDALNRLGSIADLFLVHNRPIAQHVDDSVMRMVMGEPMALRCARGYAPLPIEIGKTPVLEATGAYLKNSVAISTGKNALLSQHIGDLENESSYHAFKHTIGLFEQVYQLRPVAVGRDLHPDYLSTRYAQGLDIPDVPVQHHYAHVLSCMAEHGLKTPLLGVSWDGTGYGSDGTAWGGEFLKLSENSYVRYAHLRPFGLLSGDKAARDPRRAALGMLYEIFGDELFDMDLAPLRACSSEERKIFRSMLEKQLHTPRTTSVGRLFDAVASLVGISQQNRFEGESAMALEFAATKSVANFYPVRLTRKPARPLLVDWEPMVRAIIDDLSQLSVSEIAGKFHDGLAQAILSVARDAGEKTIVFSGGCFQNKYLAEHATLALQKEDFHVWRHRLVPPNDGGIALGQLMAAINAGRQREC